MPPRWRLYFVYFVIKCTDQATSVIIKELWKRLRNQSRLWGIVAYNRVLEFSWSSEDFGSYPFLGGHYQFLNRYLDVGCDGHCCTAGA